MSNQKHTPEPLELSLIKSNGKEFISIENENSVIAAINFWDNEPEQEANADRIVACVNACAGMKDPQSEITKLKSDNARMLNVIRVMQEATANDPTWINTNRVLSSILKDCTHA